MLASWSWRSMMKMAGSASGSVSHRHGSADPDAHQNLMDPQHLLSYLHTHRHTAIVVLSFSCCFCGRCLLYWFFIMVPLEQFSCYPFSFLDFLTCYIMSSLSCYPKLSKNLSDLTVFWHGVYLFLFDVLSGLFWPLRPYSTSWSLACLCRITMPSFQIFQYRYLFSTDM